MKVVTVTLTMVWPNILIDDTTDVCERLADYATDRLDAISVRSTVAVREVEGVRDEILDEGEEGVQEWYDRANREVDHG